MGTYLLGSTRKECTYSPSETCENMPKKHCFKVPYQVKKMVCHSGHENRYEAEGSYAPNARYENSREPHNLPAVVTGAVAGKVAGTVAGDIIENPEKSIFEIFGDRVSDFKESTRRVFNGIVEAKQQEFNDASDALQNKFNSETTESDSSNTSDE